MTTYDAGASDCDDVPVGSRIGNVLIIQDEADERRTSSGHIQYVDFVVADVMELELWTQVNQKLCLKFGFYSNFVVKLKNADS